MPVTKSRHAHRRDRVAMAGPAVPSRLAKWIPIMIPMRTCRIIRRRVNRTAGKSLFTLIMRWVTGEAAEMDSEDIERELFEFARDWIMVSQSKFKKLLGHQSKPTNVLLWKQFREYRAKKGSILI
jgi:hypothetical protein